jgi:hypothetical protein
MKLCLAFVSVLSVSMFAGCAATPAPAAPRHEHKPAVEAEYAAGPERIEMTWVDSAEEPSADAEEALPMALEPASAPRGELR